MTDMTEPPTVCMAAPWYLMCRPETAFAWAETYVDLARMGQVYEIGCFDCPLDIARSQLVAEFMATTTHPHDALLMIDADMHWRPQHVRRLLGHNEQIVAVVGADKRTGRFYAGKIGHGKGQRVQTNYERERGLLAVDRCGACFMMIRRRAIAQMMETYPELHLHAHEVSDERLRPFFFAFFEHKASDGWLPSEDFRFCDLARGAGIQVYVDPWIELTHIVPMGRTGKLIDHLDFGDQPIEAVG